MTDAAALKLFSLCSIVLAFAAAFATLIVGGYSPALTGGMITFLFVGLVGGFASRAIQALEKRIATLESRS